jgi:hypothetical protein
VKYESTKLVVLQACVKYLLMSESKEEMQDRFRKEFENIWPGDFLNYFKEKILPKVGFYASEAFTPCSSQLSRCRTGSGRSLRTSGQGTFSTTSRRRSYPR